jgi:DNA-binding NarL/FixJ family response regulator
MIRRCCGECACLTSGKGHSKTSKTIPVRGLVRLLRAQNFRGKIVVLSAYLSEENRRAYEELSVDTMLPKRFEIGELRQVIDSLADAA